MSACTAFSVGRHHHGEAPAVETGAVLTMLLLLLLLPVLVLACRSNARRGPPV
jgi:hypothetical protein